MRPALAETADLVVRDALGGPDRSRLALAGAVDLEMPDLFRVGEGEAFAPIVVAVGFRQLVGDADGLPGRFRPLEARAGKARARR